MNSNISLFYQIKAICKMLLFGATYANVKLFFKDGN